MTTLPSQFIVDAFTDQLFAGNPAAVCLQPLPEALMQRVAQENNLSETAFPDENRRRLCPAVVHPRRGD